MRRKDFKYFSLKKYDGMIGRCYRISDRGYKNYGARGIRVCKDWLVDINSFRTWILSELDRLEISIETFVSNSKKIQLDRIDNEGHYTPSNCKLSSIQQNARNKRSKVLYEVVTAEGERIKI